MLRSFNDMYHSQGECRGSIYTVHQQKAYDAAEEVIMI